MERHHRNLDDPWSLRQSGVYQQLHNDKQLSKYIFLNPSDQARRLVEKPLASKKRCCDLRIHAMLLNHFGANWPDYVEYLTTELRKHVRYPVKSSFGVLVANSSKNDRACYTSIDRPDKHDFIANYQNLQDLHMLQTKIERATFAIECCIKIGQACREHSENHVSIPMSACCATACSKCIGLIETYNARMSEQLHKLRRMDRRLRDILELVSLSTKPHTFTGG